jgi:hypothetical protein
VILIQGNDDSARKTIVIVVIEPDNLHRMQQADPITLTRTHGEGFLKSITYPDNVEFVIAYEEDPSRLYEMIEQGRTPDFIRDIFRGYKFRPNDGLIAAGEFKKA